MTELITRCPSCSVSFRASETQLQAANGKVRCGACLGVFDARSNEVLSPHFVAETKTTTPEDELMIFDEMELDQHQHSEHEHDEEKDQTAPTQTVVELSKLTATFEGPAQDYLAAADIRAIDSNLQPTTDFYPESAVARKHKPLVWSFLSLLTIMLLGLQYLFFNADLIAKRYPNTGWLDQFCAVAGCIIPPQTNTKLIQNNHLVIRSHPTIANALMIDAVIINHAQFKQPFPILVLSFENLQGKQIASRHFKPTEYLQGNLAGEQFMPSEQPIHFVLELMDPGQEAVSYSLYIPE